MKACEVLGRVWTVSETSVCDGGSGNQVWRARMEK